MTNDLTILGNSVHLNLLGVLNVLGDNHRVLSRNLSSLVQVVLKILLRVNCVHGSTRKNIRRSDKHRVRHLVTEVLSLSKASKLLPSRLINLNAIQHTRELVSVLSVINHLRRSTQHLDTSTVQRQSNVVRRLSTHSTQNTTRVLKLVNIKNSLKVNVLKVKLISFIVISGDRFRIIIDHNCLKTCCSECSDGSD